MKVQVESPDKVNRNITVSLDEDKVNELREEIYDDLKKHAKIKGFRPGKVPKNVIQAYYKDYVDDELKKKMVEATMGDALKEVDVQPVSEPHIHFSEENQFTYTMECEITPDFDLPNYIGIETEVSTISVNEEDVAKRIESMREMHAEMVDRAADEPAVKGDLLIVQYQGFRDGKPVDQIKSDSYPIDLSGNANLMPEFEAGLIGMKTGEDKPIEVNFGEDYPDKDIAGKTITFQVHVKEVKKRVLPEVNDDFAKDVGFESMEVMKVEVQKELDKEQDTRRRRAMSQKVTDFLITNSDIPVPPRLLQKRVEMAVQDARSRMRSDDMSPEDENGLLTAMQLRYEPEVEKRIKVELALKKIADLEGINVDDKDADDRLVKIAEETKRSYDYVKEFYDKYDLTANLKSSIREERTVNFLLEKAVIKEKESEQE
jgi:trigger factor